MRLKHKVCIITGNDCAIVAARDRFAWREFRLSLHATNPFLVIAFVNPTFARVQEQTTASFPASQFAQARREATPQVLVWA
jgi:hypothetical protein